MPDRPRLRDIPAHAHGRFRHDPLMWCLATGFDFLNWFDGFSRLPDTRLGRPQEYCDVVVTERRLVARDQSVVALSFELPGGGELPSWSPGAHLDVELPSGTRRQYSLCGDPADPSRYRIAVRLIPDGGGGSAEVHRELQVGSRLRIGLPRNAFPLAVGGHNQRTSAVRLIAGGIGITPILPMITLLERTAMPWSMIYCGRSSDSMAFLPEVANYGDKITVHCDDESGFATPAKLLGDLAGTPAVYTCGPPLMVDMLRAALAERPDVEFHYERFSAAPVVDGQEFTIHLATTGEVVTVGAEQTALDAILTARPDATYSCRQGFCRSCAVRVLAGTPEHRSTALNSHEQDAGYFLPCVSRAEGSLTVEL
ncbi:PDR/VanB family oxidoreductase [Nocardia africana]|uniref:Phthalate dioxygenase reductase n=1 Tax=Nocardia africana TaxID=134964 RepID=A0A378WXG9_9NOCA|nr:PDR/VanB family oxidoreductase [Nocardia africana]MCC3313610.1 PDR/VanB family oxidoreductase [Nocardia africana]SUA45013.1 Phthalate dioxygenase reductase [Nocardia africana]